MPAIDPITVNQTGIDIVADQFVVPRLVTTHPVTLRVVALAVGGVRTIGGNLSSGRSVLRLPIHIDPLIAGGREVDGEGGSSTGLRYQRVTDGKLGNENGGCRLTA